MHCQSHQWSLQCSLLVEHCREKICARLNPHLRRSSDTELAFQETEGAVKTNTIIVYESKSEDALLFH